MATALITAAIAVLITCPASSAPPPQKGGNSGKQPAHPSNKVQTPAHPRTTPPATSNPTHHPAIQPPVKGQQPVMNPGSQSRSAQDQGTRSSNSSAAREFDAARLQGKKLVRDDHIRDVPSESVTFDPAPPPYSHTHSPRDTYYGSSGTDNLSTRATEQKAQGATNVQSTRPAREATLDDNQGQRLKPRTPAPADDLRAISGGNSSNNGQKSGTDTLRERGIAAGGQSAPAEPTNSNPAGPAWKEKRYSLNDSQVHLNELTREAKLQELTDPKNALDENGPHDFAKTAPGRRSGADLVNGASQNPRASDGKNQTSKQGQLSDVGDDVAAAIIDAARIAGGGSVKTETDPSGTLSQTVKKDATGTIREVRRYDSETFEERVWKFNKAGQQVSSERWVGGVKVKSTPNPDSPDSVDERGLPAVLKGGKERLPSVYEINAMKQRKVSQPGEGREQPARMNVDKRELMEAGLLRRTDGRSQPVPEEARNSDRRGVASPKSPIRPGGPDEGQTGVPTPTKGRGPNPDDPTADPDSDKDDDD
jgi:hypothetical protein